MTKKIMILAVLLIMGPSLFAYKSKTVKNNDRLSLIFDYHTPVNSEGFNANMAFGLGYKFWGIFEFSGYAYSEVEQDENNFLEIGKVHAPSIFSLGVGAAIPMGGFSIKGDYQHFFNGGDQYTDFSMAKYKDSFKYGIGLELSPALEMEVYMRTMFNVRESYSYLTDEEMNFVGVGFKLSL